MDASNCVAMLRLDENQSGGYHFMNDGPNPYAIL